MSTKKTLSDKMILSSVPTQIKFFDKKGKMIKVDARKCGQKMYLQRDVKRTIKFIRKTFFPCEGCGDCHKCNKLNKELGKNFA